VVVLVVKGDAGSSQFYVSMEDDLMRLFAGDRIKSLMERLNIPDDQEIENKVMAYSIESAQKRVEGRNFDIRKHVLQYDNVMNYHRNLIYSRRKQILQSTELRSEIREMIRTEIINLIRVHTDVETDQVDLVGAERGIEWYFYFTERYFCRYASGSCR
jgi:preprotein translocase subunit SecA